MIFRRQQMGASHPGASSAPLRVHLPQYKQAGEWAYVEGFRPL